MGTAAEILPGVTLDPKDETGLEAAFGVTSNAEELVKQNRARYTPEQRKALRKSVNLDLSQSVQERDVEADPERLQYGHATGSVAAELEDHLDHPVETAVVRGSGRGAVISYTYVGDRGSIEKDTVPFADVFGSGSDKRESRKQTGAEKANATLSDADSDAQEKLKAAAAEAQEKLDKARAEAEKLVAEAHAEAAKIREKAAEKAAKEGSEGDDEEDNQPAAKKSGGAKKSSGGRRSSSAKRSG